MKKLEAFTQKQVIQAITDEVMCRLDVEDEALAKKLVLNALCYNVVVFNILDKVQELLKD